MSTVNSVKITCAYTNTDFKRVYQFDGVSAAHLSNVKSNILSLNNTLNDDEDGRKYVLRGTFISDDFDQSQDIGWLKEITKAEITTVNETKIPVF